MSEFSDLEVMAYVDGELPADRAAALRQALAGSAGLRARVEAYAASRRILQRSFEPVLHAPLPERLLQLIDPPAPRASRRRWRPAPWALAAAVGGLALGLGWWRQPAPGLGPEPLDALVLAALERTPSGETLQREGQAVVPLATLQRADGRYCRDYAMRQGAQEHRARACREPSGTWVAQHIEVAPAQDYRPASGDTSAALLTVEEEAVLIDEGWRATRP